MRFPLLALLFLVLGFSFGFTQIAPAHAATADSIIESHRPSKYAKAGVDRPGMDYRSFEMDDANVNTCEFACTKEAQCRAWTYVKPGVQGPMARCWLKTGVPLPRLNGCCTSGLKAGICDVGYRWDSQAGECRHLGIKF
jgi:hypothetical protein